MKTLLKNRHLTSVAISMKYLRLIENAVKCLFLTVVTLTVASVEASATVTIDETTKTLTVQDLIFNSCSPYYAFNLNGYASGLCKNCGGTASTWYRTQYAVSASQRVASLNGIYFPLDNLASICDVNRVPIHYYIKSEAAICSAACTTSSVNISVPYVLASGDQINYRLDPVNIRTYDTVNFINTHITAGTRLQTKNFNAVNCSATVSNFQVNCTKLDIQDSLLSGLTLISETAELTNCMGDIHLTARQNATLTKLNANNVTVNGPAAMERCIVYGALSLNGPANISTSVVKDGLSAPSHEVIIDGGSYSGSPAK